MSQTPNATAGSSHSKKFTRYQLPGFGLPLNFTPNDEYTTNDYNYANNSRGIVHPALGDFGALYPNTLDGQRAR
jgi:hypothetical protein